MNFVRFLLVLSVFFFPIAASADSGTDAIDAISKANKAYESGDFYEAIRQYRSAFDITKDARVLYRIGITYESLGNFQRAREFLERYLKQSDDQKYVGRVKKKVETLRKLERTVQATAVLKTRPGRASVFLLSESDKAFGQTPMNIPLAPGSHTFIFKKEGYESETLTIQIDASQVVKETVKLKKVKSVSVVKKKKKITPKPVEEEPIKVPEVKSINDLALRPVQLGPSQGVNVLLWIGIGLSAASVIVAAIGVADSSSDIPSLPLFLGATGMFSLSGYFLWIHDWNSDLAIKASLPPTKSFSIELKF